MPKFLTAVDLTQNEIRNARVQNLATAPATPVVGQVYFNTVSGLFLVWDGSVWSSVKGPAGGDLTGAFPSPLIAAGAVDNSKIAAGAAIALSKLATDPLARANHTGTQLAATVSDFDTQVRTSRLDQMANPTASVVMNSQKITDLAQPTNPQDAATKSYVDASSLGLDIKDSVRAASTENLTLSGTQTVDGVALTAGQRILVKDQTDATQNGIYVVAAGAWARSIDADSSEEVSPGMFTFVEEGTVNADSGWVLTTDGVGGSIDVGAVDMDFVQFSGAGQVEAGAGLTKTGPSLDVVGTADRILVTPNAVDIASTYVGQTSLTTLGTVTTGTWTGTTIAVANGGTGATTAVAARASLGAITKYSAFNGGTDTDVITHSLNTTDVMISVKDVATGQIVAADMFVTDADTVTVTYGVAATASTLRITVIG
jgi:hypothetical protein